MCCVVLRCMLWNSHLLSGCLHPCLDCSDIFVAQVEGQGLEDSRRDCLSLKVMCIAQSSNVKERMAVAENGRPLGFAEGFRFHPLQGETGQALLPARDIPEDGCKLTKWRLLIGRVSFGRQLGYLLCSPCVHVDDLYNFGPSPQTPSVPDRPAGLILVFQAVIDRF